MIRILVFLSILINSIINVFLFSGSTVNTDNSVLLEKIFWPFQNIRYGYWLAKRWFLPFIALSTLIPWYLEQNRGLNFIKSNKKYITLIFVFLFVARILSFTHWFYLDDFRFLGNFLQQTSDIQNIPCCGEGYPAQWIMYLVMRWFGTNFYFYNALGLITYFLIGICIFAIGNKIQNNKFVSLLSALFFVTTPTYFHATIAMVDHTGDSFSLLLFSISLYFLLKKSISRCLIFAAAALEFGLSRTHFIALPLIFTSLIHRNNLGMKNVFIIIVSLFLISLPYYPILAVREANEYNASTFFLNSKNILISANAVSHALVPFQFLKVVGNMFTQFPNNEYLSPLIGIGLITLLIILSLKSPKIFLVGGAIIIGSLTFPPMFGVRTDRNMTGFTKELTSSLTPLPSTGYGLFPALGLTVILIGLLRLTKNRQIFGRLLAFVIIFNTLSFIYFDQMWNEIHVNKDKAVIETITTNIPTNGVSKAMFLDPSAYVVRRNILTTLLIYRPNENIVVVDDAKDPALKDRETYFTTYDGLSNKLFVIITKSIL